MARFILTPAVISIALALTATTTNAADLGSPRGYGGYGYPPPYERRSDLERWTGFYLGGTLGYGWGEAEAQGTIGSVSIDQSGVLGTIFAGYNWQIGGAVLGIEADIGTGDFGGSRSTAFGQLRTDLNAIGSMRARAGFLVSPALLLYGTAGLAWTSMDFQLDGTEARSETFMGYQVGLGGELKMSEHTTLRLEYIYTGLPSERVIHGGLSDHYDPSFNTVRAGIAIKF